MKKKRRYIISDTNMGVFLGTYNGYDLGMEDDGRIYACFAANNPFGLTTACSFKTERAAHTNYPLITIGLYYES